MEKTDKIYFCCRRLQNSQNLRRNGSFSKLACMQREEREIIHFLMRLFLEGFTSSLVVNIPFSRNLNRKQ